MIAKTIAEACQYITKHGCKTDRDTMVSILTSDESSSRARRIKYVAEVVSRYLSVALDDQGNPRIGGQFCLSWGEFEILVGALRKKHITDEQFRVLMEKYGDQENSKAWVTHN